MVFYNRIKKKKPLTRENVQTLKCPFVKKDLNEM